MSGKHAGGLKPLFVQVGDRRVELPPAGSYVHPPTGLKYHLLANMSSHQGPGYAVTGWPTFWEELVPE